MARNQRERRACIALAKLVGYKRAEYPELERFHHIPNGEDRHPAVGAILKAMGTKKGVPDYSLPVPRGGWHGFYLEMKAPGETVRDDQLEWIETLIHDGYYVAVAWGWEEAWEYIERYLKGEYRR